MQATGLVTGNPYKFKVSALNNVGESLQSEPALLVYSARTPDPPTNLATVSSSSTHITFNWVIPYNGGSPITFYQIFWDKGNGGLFSTFTELAVTINPDNEFILDYGLTPGNVY